MGLVQLGNVPEWVQAATGAVNLYSALRNRRQKQALDWAAVFEELAGLDREELRRTIEENPAIAELVGLAWEAGAETADTNKRRLLAKVAAAALRGDTTPGRVDELQLLLRTVRELDPLHVALLAVMGAKGDGRPREACEVSGRELRLPPEEDQITREQLSADWPSAPDLLDPAIAALERAGLIMPLSDAYGGTTTSWVLRPYGRRFLDYLLVDEGGWPQTTISRPGSSAPSATR
jgi:hypothetical protein